MHGVVKDIAESLEQAGVLKLAIVNGHGGNYVLSNIVQEANVKRRQMVLFPRSTEWAEAREAADLETSNHEDMHGGEAETSILLAESPEIVRASYNESDFIVDDRRYLLTIGVRGYSKLGVIGRPSLASERKGHLLLDSFSAQFKDFLDLLRQWT